MKADRGDVSGRLSIVYIDRGASEIIGHLSDKSPPVCHPLVMIFTNKDKEKPDKPKIIQGKNIFLQRKNIFRRRKAAYFILRLMRKSPMPLCGLRASKSKKLAAKFAKNACFTGFVGNNALGILLKTCRIGAFL